MISVAYKKISKQTFRPLWTLPQELHYIGALFSLFGAILTALINLFREYSERQKWGRNLAFEKIKWERTLELEQRRIRHEENRWVLELNSHRELELYKMRLKTYPEVLAALELLSKYRIDNLTEDAVTELASKLNIWGYSEVGLCMSPTTRDTLFILRDELEKYLRKEMTVRALIAGARIDLIELMRSDLNHASTWREFETLTGRNFADMQKFIVERVDDKKQILHDNIFALDHTENIDGK